MSFEPLACKAADCSEAAEVGKNKLEASGWKLAAVLRE
jgi:hypothetical protein